MRKSKIIAETDNHTVEDDEKYIIKKFKHNRSPMHLTSEWSILYQGLYEKFQHITPELIDFEPGNTIVMEKVPGISIEQLIAQSRESHDDLFLKKFKQCLNINKIIEYAFAEYSLDLDDLQYAYHTDINPKNVIVQDFNTFKFIDIDSIKFDFIFMRQTPLESWLGDMYAEHRTLVKSQHALSLLDDLING
jgi:serine/threonine protein kinase